MVDVHSPFLKSVFLEKDIQPLSSREHPFRVSLVDSFLPTAKAVSLPPSFQIFQKLFSDAHR
jgi:hypothetical protein